MTKVEFEDLEIDRSIVRFKNINDEHVRGLVAHIDHDNGNVLAVQFKTNMPFAKHYSELVYCGTHTWY